MHDIYKHRAKEIWLPHKTNVVLAGVAVNGGGKYDASGLEQILKSHSRHEDGRDMRLDDDARGEDYPRVFVVAVEVSRSTRNPDTAAACDVVWVTCILTADCGCAARWRIHQPGRNISMMHVEVMATVSTQAICRCV